MSDDGSDFGDARVKHLEMIQGVISRLSSHSMLVKGWSVTLVAALFALAGDEANANFVFLVFFPVPLFWALDGFFLWKEREFREIYDHVQECKESVDFSMAPRDDSKATYRDAVFSLTLSLFHGATMALSVIVVLLILLLAK